MIRDEFSSFLPLSLTLSLNYLFIRFCFYLGGWGDRVALRRRRRSIFRTSIPSGADDEGNEGRRPVGDQLQPVLYIHIYYSLYTIYMYCNSI